MAAVAKKYKTEFPTKGASDVMSVLKIPYKKFKCGKAGTCLDFNYLGECTGPCTYNHSIAELTEKHQDEVAQTLEKGLVELRKL